MIPRTFSCVLILTLASVPGFGQKSAETATQPGTAAVVATAASVPAIPKDPKNLMLMAAKLNGLASTGSHPWHVKANYQIFDADGKPKDKGTFEEWWAGPEKWKVRYTSNGFNQVRYRTGKKTLMTGDDTAPSLADELLQRSVVYPIPAPKAIKPLKFAAHDAKDGSVDLTCLREDEKSFLFTVFCFDKSSSAVRLEALPDGNMVFFNNIVSIDGKYLSKQIDVTFANLPVMSAQVTTLEPLTKVDGALLEPPVGALPALSPPLFEPPGEVGIISIGKHPKTPAIAKAAHVHGTVVLAVMISPKGEVSEVRVISGPVMLRQAAIDSVKTYHFEPYKWHGQPTVIEELIRSNFY